MPLQCQIIRTVPMMQLAPSTFVLLLLSRVSETEKIENCRSTIAVDDPLEGRLVVLSSFGTRDLYSVSLFHSISFLHRIPVSNVASFRIEKARVGARYPVLSHGARLSTSSTAAIDPELFRP